MASTRTDVSDAQRAKMREYLRLGYQCCVITYDGSVVPGYADYMLEIVLDSLDLSGVDPHGVIGLI
jgi:hypothetical protein